jgi:hypothetical protein
MNGSFAPLRQEEAADKLTLLLSRQFFLATEGIPFPVQEPGRKVAAFSTFPETGN